MIRLIQISSLAVAMAISSALPSFADTINFMGTGKGLSVSIDSPGLGTVQVHAGELNWRFVTPGPEGLATQFLAYCVDASSWLASSQTVTLRSSDGLDIAGVADAGEKAAWLIDTYAPAIHAVGSNTEAAALQVAIWAALYNPTGALRGGTFALNTTGAVATQAQTYLNALFSNPANRATALWLDVPARAGQDQLTMSPVPEPGTIVLLGSGLAMAWRARRRRSTFA